MKLHTLINRIGVDKDNKVSISLRVDPEVIHALPNPWSEASLPHESPPLDDSQQALLGNPNRGCRDSRWVSIETALIGVRVAVINSLFQARIYADWTLKAVECAEVLCHQMYSREKLQKGLKHITGALYEGIGGNSEQQALHNFKSLW